MKTNNEFNLGFRLVGGVRNDRRLVESVTAFNAYCAMDSRAEVERVAYLSAFSFGTDFKTHLSSSGSTSGFVGQTWSPILRFDIDGPTKDIAGLTSALEQCRKMLSGLLDRYDLNDQKLLVSFSGSKGFHIGLPSALWNPDPAIDFHLHCRRFAESLAAMFDVSIDSSVYDRVRAFRAPNSRHPSTGLHKRRLTVSETLTLTPVEIIELARRPVPFEFDPTCQTNDLAVADWQEALVPAATDQKYRIGIEQLSLNRMTLDFIREGALTGDRHRRLFSAAANLSEFGCSQQLAEALLTEAALDCGLPPAAVKRQIKTGLEHGRAK